jgi:hypothetical protein
MTILDNLMPRKRGPAPLVPALAAPAIEAKLAAVETELAEVAAQIDHYAFHVEMQTPGAAEELAIAKGRDATLRERQSDLRRALATAHTMDAQARTASRKAEFKHMAKRAEKKLAERDAALGDAAAAIAKAVAAFNAAYAANCAARRAWPAPMGVYPDETLGDVSKLCRAVREEMWRVGGAPVLHTVTDTVPPAFAGLSPGDLHISSIGAHPNNFMSLTDRAAASTKHILDTLNGRPVDWAMFDRQRDPEHLATMAAHEALSHIPHDPAAAAARWAASLGAPADPEAATARGEPAP